MFALPLRCGVCCAVTNVITVHTDRIIDIRLAFQIEFSCLRFHIPLSTPSLLHSCGDLISSRLFLVLRSVRGTLCNRPSKPTSRANKAQRAFRKGSRFADSAIRIPILPSMSRLFDVLCNLHTRYCSQYRRRRRFVRQTARLYSKRGVAPLPLPHYSHTTHSLTRIRRYSLAPLCVTPARCRSVCVCGGLGICATASGRDPCHEATGSCSQ